jgi:CBS domain-containing protein
MLGRGERAAVVARDGAVLGIVTVTDVRKVPRDDWHETRVATAMTPREKVTTVPAAMHASDVLALLGTRSLNQVPVLDEGRMVGLIGRRELIERVQHATAHDTHRPEPPEIRT